MRCFLREYEWNTSHNHILILISVHAWICRDAKNNWNLYLLISFDSISKKILWFNKEAYLLVESSEYILMQDVFMSHEWNHLKALLVSTKPVWGKLCGMFFKWFVRDILWTSLYLIVIYSIINIEELIRRTGSLWVVLRF